MARRISRNGMAEAVATLVREKQMVVAKEQALLSDLNRALSQLGYQIVSDAGRANGRGRAKRRRRSGRPSGRPSKQRNVTVRQAGRERVKAAATRPSARPGKGGRATTATPKKRKAKVSSR